MQELLKKDLHWILRRTPGKVIKALKSYPGRVFLAGGFIRACVSGEEVSDIDLFVPSKMEADLLSQILLVKETKVFTSDNAITLKYPDNTPPIQIIHRWTYEKPEELIESFDFTIAKSVVWFDGENWQSLIHDTFYADLAAKRLTYTSPQRNEDAGGSMLRVLKFYQKGYRIPLDSLGAVMARLVMGIKLYAVPPVPLDAREAFLSKVLTGLLIEVDPNHDPEHIFHLPSGNEEDNDLQKVGI